MVRPSEPDEKHMGSPRGLAINRLAGETVPSALNINVYPGDWTKTYDVEFVLLSMMLNSPSVDGDTAWLRWSRSRTNGLPSVRNDAFTVWLFLSVREKLTVPFWSATP
ncbi:Uncharacterised protein [uncultured archaeon]|nr:Uncharacterised protein [uncultured archaeon]